MNCCVDVVHQKLSSIYVGATVQVSDSVVFGRNGKIISSMFNKEIC